MCVCVCVCVCGWVCVRVCVCVSKFHNRRKNKKHIIEYYSDNRNTERSMDKMFYKHWLQLDLK